MEAFLLIPALGAVASLATGVYAYISGKIHERQKVSAEVRAKEVQAEETTKLLVELRKLDPNNLRLSDAEHPDKFIDVTPQQLGQIAEQYGHDS